MFALRSFSLVPECVVAAADKREECLEVVEVPGSVELLGSVVVQVPVAAADSEVVFHCFAWVPVSGTIIVHFLVLFSRFLGASSAFLARFSLQLLPLPFSSAPYPLFACSFLLSSFSSALVPLGFQHTLHW